MIRYKWSQEVITNANIYQTSNQPEFLKSIIQLEIQIDGFGTWNLGPIRKKLENFHGYLMNQIENNKENFDFAPLLIRGDSIA